MLFRKRLPNIFLNLKKKMLDKFKMKKLDLDDGIYDPYSMIALHK